MQQTSPIKAMLRNWNQF